MKAAGSPLKVALIGNPSVGKSTLFSRLTGIGVLISNYPGTTMEVAHGRVCHDRICLDLSDLPGVYSLDGNMPEEQTVLKYLREEKPDVILNVLDATRLERNLYLTLELLELDTPVIVSLNMIDEAQMIGVQIDAQQLSQLLHVPVVPTSSQKGIGLEELMHEFQAPPDPSKNRHVKYDRHIEEYLRTLTALGLSRHDAVLLLTQGPGTGQYPEAASTAADRRPRGDRAQPRGLRRRAHGGQSLRRCRPDHQGSHAHQAGCADDAEGTDRQPADQPHLGFPHPRRHHPRHAAHRVSRGRVPGDPDRECLRRLCHRAR